MSAGVRVYMLKIPEHTSMDSVRSSIRVIFGTELGPQDSPSQIDSRPFSSASIAYSVSISRLVCPSVVPFANMGSDIKETQMNLAVHVGERECAAVDRAPRQFGRGGSLCALLIVERFSRIRRAAPGKKRNLINRMGGTQKRLSEWKSVWLSAGRLAVGWPLKLNRAAWRSRSTAGIVRRCSSARSGVTSRPFPSWRLSWR